LHHGHDPASLIARPVHLWPQILALGPGVSALGLFLPASADPATNPLPPLNQAPAPAKPSKIRDVNFIALAQLHQ